MSVKMNILVFALSVFLGLCASSNGQVWLSSIPAYAIEGTEYSLVCNEYEVGWNSAWYKDGVEVHSVRKMKGGETNCRSYKVLHINQTEIQVEGICASEGFAFILEFSSMPLVLNASKWTCSIDGRKSEVPFTVVVQERPKITITATPNEGFMNDTVILIEENTVLITCSVTSSLPSKVTAELNLAGSSLRTISNSTGSVAKATWEVFRGFSYINCSVVNKDKTLSTGSIKMNILYPPTVAVHINSGSQLIPKGRVTLLCDVVANPEVHEVFWRHYINGYFIREFTRNASSTSLHLGDITYEDDGEYYCKATNLVSEDFKFDSVVIGVIGPPVIIKIFPQRLSTSESECVQFAVSYLDNSSARNETWLLEGQGLPFAALQESKRVDIRMFIHGAEVTRLGHEATLTLSQVTKNHSGNYSVVICSEINCTESDVITLSISDGNRTATVYIHIIVFGTAGFLLLVIAMAITQYRKRRIECRHADNPKEMDMKAVTRQTSCESLVVAENLLYESTAIGQEEINEGDYTTVEDEQFTRDSYPSDNVLYE